MRGHVIAFLGSEDAARELGKKGTSTDITFYNQKKGDQVYTILIPSRYPEKPQPLGHTLTVANLVILEISEIGPTLGEQVIAIKHSGHNNIIILLRNYLTEEQIAPLLKDANIEYTILDDKELRENLDDFLPEKEEGESLTVIDQSFNVKGVGTVALGFVISGELKKHGEPITTPGGKKCTIRSIQVQDEDQQEVGPGTRVGLALRNIDADDLTRGSILAPREYPIITKASLKLERSKYWGGKLEPGTILHLSTLFQFVPARVDAVGDTVDITLESPLINVNKPILVFQLDSGKQRIVGGATLVDQDVS